MPPPDPVTTATLPSNRPITPPSRVGETPAEPLWITYTDGGGPATAGRPRLSTGRRGADHLVRREAGEPLVVDADLAEHLGVVLAEQRRGPLVPRRVAHVPHRGEARDAHLACDRVDDRLVEAAGHVLLVVDDDARVHHRRDGYPGIPEACHQFVPFGAGEGGRQLAIDGVVRRPPARNRLERRVARPFRIVEPVAQGLPVRVALHRERDPLVAVADAVDVLRRGEAAPVALAT